MANTDLRYLSANFRERIDPETCRRTGVSDMVIQCATDKGHGRAVVIENEDQALQLIEQLAHLVTTRRALDRRRAERSSPSLPRVQRPQSGDAR